MLKVNVQVPEKRDRAGFVAIVDGFRTLIEDSAVATSGFADRKRSYGDHPPFGRYELTAHAPTPGGAETEYGNEILLFEPVAGPALEAESRGRFGVLLYGGSAGGDKLLRRTQGGVRLSRRAMDVLLANIGDAGEVELQIEVLAPVPWWVFWRRRRTPPPLSRDPPRLTAPPFNEATLTAQMLQSAIRRERKPRRDEDSDRDDRRDRDSGSATARESGSEFRGGGGTGGGGGATGAWVDAPAAGRGPGVSAAGIIAGAAGVAALAAAASGKDSASSTSIDAEAGSFSDSGSSGTDNDSSSTTTSTAY